MGIENQKILVLITTHGPCDELTYLYIGNYKLYLQLSKDSSTLVILLLCCNHESFLKFP